MTPEQKIKHLIILRHFELAGEAPPESITAENVDEIYDDLEDPWDARNEVRQGMYETEISPPSSRHYETRSVADQLPDGSWVGWTYYYGGGKHGEPEAVDWMEDAYELSVTEVPTVVTVRTWTKLEASSHES